LNPVLAMKSFLQAKKQLLKLLRTAKIIPLISILPLLESL